MNQLIRGAERSGCFQRAGRQAFSAHRSVSGVSAQSIISYDAEPNNRRGYPIASAPSLIGSCSQRAFPKDVFALNRNFSSLAVETVESDDDQDESLTTTPRKPSALEQANLEEVTPGHCLSVLQIHAAKGTGNKLIRQSDFVTLCESSRPGKLRDAKVIAIALKDFKRCNRFVLQMESARAAIVGMLRSMTPTWKVQDGKPRVKAALFVAEQIMDETTGLYFAIETPTADIVLEELHKGLLEMEENGIKLKVENVGDDAEADAEEEPNEVDKLLKDSLRLTEGVVKSLIKRKSRPEYDMKKRAKRKYLKRLQIGSGPFRSTLQAATKISLLLGESALAEEKIISPFTELQSSYFLDPVTQELIEKAKEIEEASAAEAAAAAAEEARAAEAAAAEEARAAEAAAAEEAKAAEAAAAAAEEAAGADSEEGDGESAEDTDQEVSRADTDAGDGEAEGDQKDEDASEEGKKD